ncbi:INO80 complex subunit D-like [Ylistrum balloti]|uniref:INO80 complex subunit D-like n=1 Tax=Ylistrum balloti TaxID=509963 RepID=UPI002905B354|nr:INO80 complex subunit D-like [Ylistrum balloti]
MYEGKNIHYSSSDKKPLCSFSSKVCNQHRLNGYAFCVRHILEDPTAPFKRCAYMAKSSKQNCTQAIPEHEDRPYCNNHMQVLGMLPRKERKKKEKEKEKETEKPVVNEITLTPVPLENKTVFNKNRVKPRFENRRLHMSKLHMNKDNSGLDDPEDPYAFPDTGNESATKVNSSPLSSSANVETLAVTTPNSSGGKSPGGGVDQGGVSSIAKLYPELAEKLEKIKPKFDIVKGKEKGKERSSRTMNILQSKIAQNRIKDKMKKNQESSSQSQSPSHGFNNCVPNSISLSHNIGTPNHSDHGDMGDKTPNSDHDGLSPLSSNGNILPGHSHNRMGPSHLLPSPTHDMKRSSQTPFMMMPQQMLPGPGIPPPTRTLPPEGIPHGMLAENLPGMPRADHLPPHYSRVHHAPPIPHMEKVGPVLHNLQQEPSDHFPIPTSTLPLQSLSSHSQHHHQLNNMVTPTPVSMPSPHLYPHHHPSHPSHPHLPPQREVQPPPMNAQPLPPPPPPYRKYPASVSMTIAPSVTLPTVSTSMFMSPTVTVNSSSVHPEAVLQTGQARELPPPPPYSSTVCATPKPPTVTKRSKSKPKTWSISAPVISKLFSPEALMKPHSLKHVLPEADVSKRLHEKKAAIQYYLNYVRWKMQNHSFLGSDIRSSDEEASDDENDDLLPWQPEWFTVSSDEEANEDDDDQDDSLRTAKLALIRARLRRRCFQSRKSYRANTSERLRQKTATLGLIEAAREESRSAVKALHEINCYETPPVDIYKVRGLVERQCCHKNDEEVQCENDVLPYANHCLKHIMYNVDQQLFDYCTAKFADNTQCCVPVNDFKHELPLCMEHGLKADTYLDGDTEFKPKRPRKKTKPSALTRPPKKGKKKKNQRKNIRPQKPSPPSEPTGLTEMPAIDPSLLESEEKGNISDADMSGMSNPDLSQTGSETETFNEVSESDALPDKVAEESTEVSKTVESVESPLPKETSDRPSLTELPEAALTALDMEKGLELPLEQASRLLEETDFQDVFNKIPDETFDLFSGKNGDAMMPTHEDVAELERHIAEANIDISVAQQALETLTNGSMELDDEQLKQIAASLLGTSVNNMAPVNNAAPTPPVPASSTATGELCNGITLDGGLNDHDMNRTLPDNVVMVNRNAGSVQGGVRVTVSSATSMYQTTGFNPKVDRRTLVNNREGLVALNSTVVNTQNASQQQRFPHPTMDLQGAPMVTNLPQSFISHQNTLPNFTAGQGLPGQSNSHQQQQVFLQQQSQSHDSMQRSMPNIPLQQIVSVSNVSSIRTPNMNSVGNHLGIDNLQSVLVTSDKGHQISSSPQQTTHPGGHITTAWPANLANVISFQNGFPLHNTGSFQHVNDIAANLKFGVGSQRVLPSELKQDMTQQYHQVMGSPHSAPTGVRPAAPPSQAVYEGQQVRPGFSRLPPPFSASTGKGS